jgi:hypothetical protein
MATGMPNVLLILCDDVGSVEKQLANREFDYTAGAEQALERADANAWTLISIKTTGPPSSRPRAV